MSQSKTGHIVAATMLAWGKPCVFKELPDEVLILYWHCITITTLCTAGHTKSATSLLCKLVRLKNIYATFIVAIPLYDKVLKEISRQFLPGQEDDLKAMIRWVTSHLKLKVKCSSLLSVCQCSGNRVRSTTAVYDYSATKYREDLRKAHPGRTCWRTAR